jgi:hypothetical protein
MKILSFFLFFWVFFSLLDPDPDPTAQINADPCGSGYGSGSCSPLVFHPLFSVVNHRKSFLVGNAHSIKVLLSHSLSLVSGSEPWRPSLEQWRLTLMRIRIATDPAPFFMPIRILTYLYSFWLIPIGPGRALRGMSSSLAPLVSDVPSWLVSSLWRVASLIPPTVRLEAFNVYTALYVTWQIVSFFKHLDKMLEIKEKINLTFFQGSACLYCFIFLLSVIGVIFCNILDRILNFSGGKCRYCVALHLVEMDTYIRIQIHNTGFCYNNHNFVPCLAAVSKCRLLLYLCNNKVSHAVHGEPADSRLW